MTIIGELLLNNLLGYLINLAAGERSAAFATTREQKLKDAIEKDETLRKALASTHSIRDDIRDACAELARNREQLGVQAHEEPLWRLLSNDAFQTDLTEWLMAGGMEEGNAVKSRLIQTMETAMVSGGASPAQITSLKTGYFEAVDKAVFGHPVLAHWRQQLSLDYLRGQVTVLRRLAEEAAGLYSPAKQKAALDRYCETALDAWDIIDLSNLPEGDIHMATQQLLLRQLYMPLRIEVEPTQRGEGDDARLARLEEQRDLRRRREAGHFLTEETERPDRRKRRSPVGERLGMSGKLVVLGDPGGGKTTMLRWMATAYLLRHKGDAAFSQVPDTETLPAKPWIPVLIRCRDLGKDDLCRCFKDFLAQHLNKTKLLPGEAEVMRALILDRLAKGEALLLIDGLDEISDPQVRMTFCQELEHTAARYPEAPIIVTSRIVGYRDMPYRMGSGFEHGVIAELDRKDKDLFAHRWVEVTEQNQSAGEKSKRMEELLDALHSSNRIERLTGNPMLLTTLALVKRKVGKLPNRRTKLYAEAVSVLLNWNPRLYQAIDDDEAIPQLEYLAYEMCRRGVQRLTDEEVLDLLDKLRVEYPNVRAIRRREPHVFLKHLEERSSILIKSGSVWQKNQHQDKPVWEFRHLTFQEYLAARALLDGKYSGRDKSKTLAEQVGPLAGQMVESKSKRRRPDAEPEIEVPESWREALRLLVADCKDDDVDEVLLAILNPAEGEDGAKTGRPRTVLASLCLTDEPNVSQETVILILDGFVAQVREGDGGGRFRTSLSSAGAELGKCSWSEFLKVRLMQQYLRRPPAERGRYGGLWAMIEAHRAPDELAAFEVWLASLTLQLQGKSEIDRISAALVVMEVAYLDKACLLPGLSEGLLAMLPSSPPERFAAAWALGRLCIDAPSVWGESEPTWHPLASDVEILTRVLEETEPVESDTIRWMLTSLGFSRDQRAVQPAMQCLGHGNEQVRRTAVYALGRLGDKQAVVPLLARLDDQDADVRQAVIGALAQLGDKQAVAPLLARLDDQDTDVRQAVIGALAQLGDKQAVAPLLARLDDQDTDVRQAVIGALAQLGDKQAVAPLLARLDDQDTDVRQAVIGALAQLGDKQAVAPLLARLDDQDSDVCQAVIEALGQLGDKQVVAPLLSKLDDPDSIVRRAVIGALAQLGDKQAVGPLLAKLKEEKTESVKNRLAVGIALHALGEAIGTESLRQCLASDDVDLRRSTVHVYARQRDLVDQRLLSRDIDANAPWLDPREQITESHVSKASGRLGVKPEKVRSRYEALAVDLMLKLSWKS
jgi:HEAT repeat protein